MRRILAALLLAGAVLAAMPAPAGAAGPDVGSTIFQRFWDSLVSTWKNRAESQAPVWLTWIEQGEAIFLGDTSDLTQLPAVQDTVSAMRVAGTILLSLFAVLGLAEVTLSHMSGGGYSLANWFWRLLVTTVMTYGTLPATGAILRFGNFLLAEVRQYLDRHWTGNLAEFYGGFVGLLDGGPAQILLVLLFLGVLAIIILGLWFLYGGIRTAELVIHLLLWPLTWPFYLLPSMEDVPKAALRGFVMWTAIPIVVTLMLRTTIRMVMQGDLWGTIWAFIPAICLGAMTIFLPMAARRVFGQGNTGASLVGTALKMAAGLKFAAATGLLGAPAAGLAPAPAGGAAAASGTPMQPVLGHPGLVPSLTPMQPHWAAPFAQAAASYMSPATGQSSTYFFPHELPAGGSPPLGLPRPPNSMDTASLLMRQDDGGNWEPEAVLFESGQVRHLRPVLDLNNHSPRLVMRREPEGHRWRAESILSGGKMQPIAPEAAHQYPTVFHLPPGDKIDKGRGES